MKRLVTAHLMRIVMTIVIGVFLTSQMVVAQADRVNTMDWSPDGVQIAIGDSNGQISILDAYTNTVVTTFQAHTGEVFKLAYSPDGTKLASVGLDQTLRIWNTSTGTLLNTVTMTNREYAVAVSWSVNGNKIITGSGLRNPNLIVWNATTGDYIQGYSAGTIEQMSWSPNGAFLALANPSGGIAIRDGTTFGFIKFLTNNDIGGKGFDVYNLVWKSDSSQISSGSLNGTVRIWDVSTGQILASLSGNENENTDFTTSLITAITYLNNGIEIASISADGTARRWNISTGQVLQTSQLNGSAYAAAFSPDGTKLAYGGNDGTLQIVSVDDVLSATPTPTTTPTAQDLISVLKPLGCTTTCFIGIQPGVTTQSEVKAIFASRNIQYIVDTGINNDEPNGIYSWEMPTTNMSFSTYDGAPVSAFITFSKGMVRQVVVGLSIPVNTIVAAFGQPDELKTDDGDYYMFYPQQGMFFLLRTYPSLSYTTVFVLVDSSAMNRWLNNTSISPVLTCPEGSDLCSVKTATPVASATSGR